MRNGNTSETAFEIAIEKHLLSNGYQTILSKEFDTKRAIFPAIVLDFIKTTQSKEWAKLEILHGDKTGEQVLGDLCSWMDTYGALATLRHGFKCYGRKLRIAYFKAVHEMNPELIERYNQNILGLTRQLYFSPTSQKSLDLTISLNGIPISTIELKNPLTGQYVTDAIEQYKKDRDPRETIFEFKKRTLVHFAVDTEQVFMTTRLTGDTTYFLPFNQGFKGGAGNPSDKQGRTYKTAYLWEDTLQKDSLLELIARFIHLQIEHKRSDEGRKIKKETMIFPRFHQLQAVRQLVVAAKKEGVGQNYLIEHSAGSGKSNTIAWLAHQLSSLHKNNQRVFDSVIVITDRLVLDQQLQDTIYQFEHKRGVVHKIDKHSRQLAEALENAEPIIITTLQKFPFVTGQLLKLAEERGEEGTGFLPTRKVAVLIDEAHSSQGGETATDLKEVLGGEQLRQEAKKRAKEEGEEKMEKLFRSMAKRGKQANVSFFAFTATPKHKTLKVFGKRGKATHKYTMRQAIEEGFILDVLKCYTTYKVYYNLVNNSIIDEKVERKKAAKSLTKFLRLHPHNIIQKTKIIIEHFNAVTRHKIGGKAKAMVVTGSRLEAVKYKLKFDDYIKNKQYAIKTLVAFSGTVEDDKIPNVTYTEEGMNDGIKQKELPERFTTLEYQVLLVAEKYQTGFDQPLLHTMYIDKRLAGIQAVQTLSRLNRNHPLKEDTFILDFVNERSEIQQAFETYYEGAALGEEADPKEMYRIQHELDASGIYIIDEIERFCEIYFKPKRQQSSSDHQSLNTSLDPAVSRFITFQREEEEAANLWRKKLKSFRSLYSFLSQVIPYQDSDLEKRYVFYRHLSAKLPRQNQQPNYDFDDKVRLAYYRLQKISEGAIKLTPSYKIPLDGPTELGTGVVREAPISLAQLIDIINERFGTDFNQADQYFFDQLVETAIRDESIKKAAEVNPEEKFKLVFKNLLETLFIERMDQNEEIFARFMNDSTFQTMVTTWLASEAYEKLRKELGINPKPYGLKK